MSRINRLPESGSDTLHATSEKPTECHDSVGIGPRHERFTSRYPWLRDFLDTQFLHHMEDIAQE